MKTSIQDRRALARLLRILRTCTPRRPRRVLLEEAEIELWGLYRREQAQLVRQAAGLRERTAAEAAPGARVDAEPRDLRAASSVRREALRAWRARAAECAGLCAYDGYPLAPALAACIAHPLHAWPSARTLHADASRLGATEA